jgi:hypothetical protein
VEVEVEVTVEVTEGDGGVDEGPMMRSGKGM